MSAVESDEKLHDLLTTLRSTRGFDFSAYKLPSLTRRIEKRMHAVGAGEYRDYASYLEAHPDEYAELFDTILINVTSFLRDPAAWNALAAKVLPEVVARRKPIRAWSAGCASGEEAYTLAMLLAEAVGRQELPERVRIFATEVDEAALATARAGVYSRDDLEAVPPELRERYFDAAGGRYVITPDLRRAVVFGRQDLIQDPPISHLDLLVCRNTLMYFDGETQARILARFYFALEESRYLFLGKAEMIFAQRHLFEPLDLRHRIFTRAATRPRDASEWLMPETAGVNRPSPHDSRARHRSLQGLAFEEAPVAGTERALGTMVVFEDVSQVERLRDELAQARLRLESALGEVQSTKEELETTNEELRSLSEELQATNEEIQSTNEELETMNQELQSTNEELDTTNREMLERSSHLNAANQFLQSILASLRVGVVVLDPKLNVLAWNERCEDLWGVRAEEAVGKLFFGLDIGFPIEKLRPAIRGCLADGASGPSLITSATNRRGKEIRCRATCMPLRGSKREVEGAIVVMEEWKEDGAR